MDKFYNGNKLLNTLDLNNEKPEIFISTSNRSAGKTTFFNRLLVDDFIKNDKKFMLLYRYKTELSDVADKFFKDIQTLFFNEYELTQSRLGNKSYIVLKLDNKICGYATALNCADGIKKYSHLFSDVQTILFDEFLSENNNYCCNEINKFISIHTSVARGGGSQSRYLPVILIANTVNKYNIYYNALGITDRIVENAKIIRGNGWVLEQSKNQSAQNELAKSAFLNAFDNSYVDYVKNASYLINNENFIEKLKGNSTYLLTVACDEIKIGIRQYTDSDFLYASTRIDTQCKTIVSADNIAHNKDTLLLSNFPQLAIILKSYYGVGKFFFENLTVKNNVLLMLGFNIN